MNPWDILAWVAAGAASMLIVAVAAVLIIAVIVGVARSVRKPKPESRDVFRGEDRS